MLDPRTTVAILKVAAEPTRLRILLLLRDCELNVKDLTRILGQSQPRVSRHLKLMAEVGLVQRHQDGSWAYFQLSDHGAAADVLRGILARVDGRDGTLTRDAQRAEAIKDEREAAAQTYFREHAGDWDKIRALHVAEQAVEAGVRAALGDRPLHTLVDLGTGTGRMLELLADRYERGIGLDINQTMLAYARMKLEAAGTANASVRHGDLYDVALPSASADAVVMHQVLHFLIEPQHAIREAARILAPGGRVVIADFAPHELEFLRERFAHERLGFPIGQVKEWLQAAGLTDVDARIVASSNPDATEKLTVTLWTAVKPARAGVRMDPGHALKVEASSP
ncbi:MAG: metalloregulator ArsR/SmtB family transcription factor [Hyphomicrobiaceae bacterium]